ncbi:hemolysin secretion protein D [Marinomonas sp. UCMA 3892]|jgi:adhesin transport system membrane fusion protein|uniref:HlyD family efflux transporter periplasmic adaptor subunit n=1 Tax=unclassified Marinomonas TaxID=196814 RepID=UPI0016B28AF5|nr:HlyD family efflux transporter periplasmic adaptor subunit [Marinomonas sp. UCMA 3892]MBU1464790.1 HlyD family efflux transporter periplasmic adaptor subunit [Gammaproteobacteria bacterium]MBU2237992.1 HlyD family efflux transporter periplasmic adaptor subunit [Gammaproteobacteria bacterium]MBU2413545.1 HlyD family efflux transporter periplasmic adaptor subunit [Gammaproteobacteria bacterium]NLU96870.1 hemolysin secretion protein D [Marinomonas sp. UCMA 3892]
MPSNTSLQPSENAQGDFDVFGYHKKKRSLIVWPILTALVAFVVWAEYFYIDEVAQAQGEVIASSRVQLIQSVDGGVISELNVREGDRVQAGQILGQLDQTRLSASVGEIESRVFALKAKAIRLRAEILGDKKLTFPQDMLSRYQDIAQVEKALFEQRKTGIKEELRTLQVSVSLAQEEQDIVKHLQASGDVSSSEMLKAREALNAAEAKLINRKNQFLEEASAELAKVEDDLGQSEQILARKQQELQDSVFIAKVPGIVKNVSVTTVGGVLRAGEEIMQIIPIDDELLVEAKIRPQDIARVKPGLLANIRLDPFDYTIYGGVEAKVVYVSADTLKEESSKGEEIYYRVHVIPLQQPITTTIGRQIEMLPGMTAQVSIKTDKRTLMDYLLKPLRKTLSQAFGEK